MSEIIYTTRDRLTTMLGIEVFGGASRIAFYKDDNSDPFVEYVLTDGSPEAQHMAAELERIHALEDAR